MTSCAASLSHAPPHANTHARTRASVPMRRRTDVPTCRRADAPTPHRANAPVMRRSVNAPICNARTCQQRASNAPTHQCASDVPMCRSAESRRATPARQHTLAAPVPTRQYARACLHTYPNPMCWAIEPCTPGTRLSYKTFLYYLAPEYTLFGPILMQINQS